MTDDQETVKGLAEVIKLLKFTGAIRVAGLSAGSSAPIVDGKRGEKYAANDIFLLVELVRCSPPTSLKVKWGELRNQFL